MATALLHVLWAQRIGPHSIRLHFNDGTTRHVNLLPYLKDNEFQGPLRDPRYFGRFHLDECCGVPEWPNGMAFAAEFLREIPEEQALESRPSSRRSQRVGRVLRWSGPRTQCTRRYWLETAEGRRWAARVRRHVSNPR